MSTTVASTEVTIHTLVRYLEGNLRSFGTYKPGATTTA
jgi:hypothetical protein